MRNELTNVVVDMGTFDVVHFIAELEQVVFVCAHSSPVKDQLGFVEVVLRKKQPFFHQKHWPVG